MNDPELSPNRSPLRIQGGALLALAVVALSLVGGVALILSTIRAEQAHRAQAARSTELIVLLRDIARDTVNAETGQRGYFITLDRRYLAPYQAAEIRAPQVLERLKAFAAESDDPRDAGRVGRIEQLAVQKFAELRRNVALIERGDLDEARRAILTDRGRETMEELRLVIGELEDTERIRLETARAETAASEQRIEPLLLALLVLILVSIGLALSLALRNADAEARAAHAANLAAARDRADLLAHELSHRVKNLFAVVLALIRMSTRDDPAAKPVADKIAERVTALLRAQELTQGGAREGGGRGQVDLAKLVETVLAPYRSAHSVSEAAGPPVHLAEQQTTPLGLILHELVTNCVKYGAWSQPGGKLVLGWNRVKGKATLDITWREHCPAAVSAPSGRTGFGTTLLEGSIRQLSGELTRTYHDDGIEVRIRVPLT